MKIEEWQKGSESELSSLQRLELHEVWLKNHHETLRKTILDKKLSNAPEKIIQGFVEID
jgi:hypothetical protein